MKKNSMRKVLAGGMVLALMLGIFTPFMKDLEGYKGGVIRCSIDPPVAKPY